MSSHGVHMVAIVVVGVKVVRQVLGAAPPKATRPRVCSPSLSLSPTPSLPSPCPVFASTLDLTTVYPNNDQLESHNAWLSNIRCITTRSAIVRVGSVQV